MATEFIIDDRFRRLLPPLSDEAMAGLEQSLLEEGCRDPLVTWQNGDQCVLLDGHNRYILCCKHGIPFETVLKTAKDIPDRQAAEDWIDRNQLARRNLSPNQYALALGRRYERAKTGHGGDRKSSGQSGDLKSHGVRTRDRIAKDHGVGTRTVDRAGSYARAVETVKEVDPEIETKINEKNAPARTAVVKAAQLVESGQKEEAKKVLSGTPPPPSIAPLKPRLGRQYAQIAIMQLTKILPNDVERQEAYDMVIKWIGDNR